MKPGDNDANPATAIPDLRHHQDIASTTYPQGQRGMSDIKEGELLSLVSESLAPIALWVLIYLSVLIIDRKFRCSTSESLWRVAFSCLVWCRMRCWRIRNHPIHSLSFQTILWAIGLVHFLLRLDIQIVRKGRHQTSASATVPRSGFARALDMASSINSFEQKIVVRVSIQFAITCRDFYESRHIFKSGRRNYG